MEMRLDTKRTKVDERGRITIPSEYRQFFPDQSHVAWTFTGDRLIVNFEGADKVESLTDVYLYNQIMDMQKEMKALREELKNLTRMAFEKIMEDPTAGKR